MGTGRTQKPSDGSNLDFEAQLWAADVYPEFPDNSTGGIFIIQPVSNCYWLNILPNLRNLIPSP
jgi:hypothetical protein